MTGFQRHRLEFLRFQALKAGQPTFTATLAEPASAFVESVINEAVEQAKVEEQLSIPAPHFGKRRKRVKKTTTTTPTTEATMDEPEDSTEEAEIGIAIFALILQLTESL